jgi:SAM-dependent methyltransferase
MTLSLLKRMLRIPGNRYNEFMLRRAFKAQEADARGPNERPLEYSFALQALALSQHLDVLDVGPGLAPWPAVVSLCGYHVTATDQMTIYWQEKIINKHFYVIHDDITDTKIAQKFGIITCISTLEHIPKHADAVSNMASLLKEDGILIMSFPYNERRYVHNAYDLPNAGYGKGAPFITQIYSRETIDLWTRLTGLAVIQQRYFRCFTGDLWTVGARLRPMEEVSVDQPHHLTGIVLAKRDFVKQ